MKQCLIIALAFLATSCGTTKFLRSEVLASEMVELSYLEPFTYIQLIEKKNEATFSDSLSLVTKTILESAIENNSSKLKLNQKLELANDSLKTKVENEISNMAQRIIQTKTLDGITLTPVIDSLLESKNQRFLFATVATGFGRKKGNFGGQVAKGIGVGILTLGLYTPVPIKSNLTIYGFIFDAKMNNVAYSKKTNPIEKEPTDPIIIEKQLLQIFDGFFYKNN